jgi:hypothetical protein
MENNELYGLLLQTPYEQRLAAIAETFLQLQKDLTLPDDELIFDGNPDAAYRQLLEYIEPYLFDLMQHNSNKFSRALYKVDISEKVLNRNIRMNPDKSYVRVVTELMIYRAFQKVITKRLSRENKL